MWQTTRRTALIGGAAGIAGLAMPGRAPARAPSSVSRSVERLDDWRFHLGHVADMARDFGFGRDQRTLAKAGAATADAAIAGFDDTGWERVRVPHDWAVSLPFAKPAGTIPKDREDAAAAHGFKAIGRDFPGNSIGWYRCPIRVGAVDRGRRLWLEFDGVFRDCMVFVNGYIAGRNESGYAPFRVAIDDYLDYDGGVNVVTLRVDATLGEGWFYEGAGIYRPVDLVRADPLHIPQWGSAIDYSVDAAGAKLMVSTDIVNSREQPADAVLRQHLIDGRGRIVATLDDVAVTLAAGEQRTAEAAGRIEKPLLWSIEAPHRYRLIAEVSVAQTVVDRYETDFGIRTIKFDPARGFLLNGSPVKLLGTCNHQDHAGVGTGIPAALHAWRVAQLKAMGSNAWRSAHNPPASALLDACDAQGMMMIVEARINGSDEDALAQLERTIRRDRNRPSVIAWSLGNEEPHQGSARGKRITAEMQRHVRRLDLSRPTTFAFDSSWDSGAATVVDVVGFNYRTDRIEAFHAAHPQVPVYGSETGSTVATRGAYRNDPAAQVVRAYDTEHPWWASTAEAWWSVAATRPYIAGGFIWTGFDYRGEPTPYPQFPSISSYFGVLDTCGFPKDNYYYYRAWWRPDEPLVHLLPHWTWPGREGQPIEVWAYANCDEVELLLNGRSLGRKAMPRNGHLTWQVPYAAGRLEARGFAGGGRVATDVRETAGPAAAIRLSTDRRLVAAGSDDIVMVRADIVDAHGRPVPDAAVPLRFAVSRGSAIIGVGNGDPTSLERDDGTERRTFHGLAQAIVRTGGAAGPITIAAIGAGLRTGSLLIAALPA